jgi:cation transport protein ChaC
MTSQTQSIVAANVKVAIPILTRAMLEAGGIEILIGRDAPGISLLTDAERTESLRSMLSSRLTGGVWVFGYGSLVWNPAIQTAEHQIAKIKNWHRSFCVSVTAGRGSPMQPGLVLALDSGGECVGTAYRIAEEDVDTELPLLWRREMLCGAYVPRWIEVSNLRGEHLAYAIAFTINKSSSQYACELTNAEVVHRIARAKGGLGSSADYLYRTCEGLRSHGIPDLHLEELARRVKKEQADLGSSRNSLSTSISDKCLMVALAPST